MSLFQLGSFRLASGRESALRIDCDALSDSDLEAAAAMLAGLVGPFAEAVGVPSGGLRLAAALAKHAKPGGPPLVCDDVYTSGGSVRRFIDRLYSAGRVVTQPNVAVLFARGVTPSWVCPLFRLHPDLEDV